jgi:hypothetical protein
MPSFPSARLATLNNESLPTVHDLASPALGRSRMSLAVLRGSALSGMEALAVSVEMHLANGLPDLAIVGTSVPTEVWL